MKRKLLFLMMTLSLLPALQAQEENPFIAYDVPSQNLLKFNRFLINPTFSTVREDKSYINLLHRNQSVSFDDNNQMYFLSYSGRIGDRSGLGLSLYTQREGTLSNYGVLANYAYGVKLSDKSNFTFGANLSYYNSGFDESRANPVETDPFLSGFQDSSFLTFQPGFNISYGQFDFGMFAENLIDYNLKTSESITEFKDKTFSGHLQYTHPFEASSGIFEGGRLMPLARARKVGQDDFVLGGNLILDLPKIGWLQGGYDSFYGASAGIGFNLNRRISIGYTMEKGLSSNFDNFGVTHEISFAYSFTPNLTEDRVMLEADYEDSLAEKGAEEAPAVITDKDAEIAELKRRLAENDAILAELMFRQDSLENNQQRELEQRFEMVMRMVRQETGGNRPEIEEKARQVYFLNNDATDRVQQDTAKIPGHTDTKPLEGLASEKDGFDDGAPEFRELPDPTIFPNDVALAFNDEDRPDLEETIRKAYLNRTDRADRIQKDPIDIPTGTEVAVAPEPSGVTATPDRLQTSENPAVETEREMAAEIGRRRTAPALRDDTMDETANRVAAHEDERPVKSRRFLDLQDVKRGYYVVANVYRGTVYMNKFMDRLTEDGFQPAYIDNPNNGLKYVYLTQYDNWDDAARAVRSGLEGTYEGDLWVMNIAHWYANEAYAANARRIKEKADKYDVDVLRKNVVVRDKVTAAQAEDQPGYVGSTGSKYYIIANVFANPRNATRFIKYLNSLGLSASYFVNPKNNYRYVYLKRHETWNSALISYYSRLNNTYDEKIWIMRVTSNLTT